MIYFLEFQPLECRPWGRAPPCWRWQSSDWCGGKLGGHYRGQWWEKRGDKDIKGDNDGRNVEIRAIIGTLRGPFSDDINNKTLYSEIDKCTDVVGTTFWRDIFVWRHSSCPHHFVYLSKVCRWSGMVVMLNVSYIYNVALCMSLVCVVAIGPTVNLGHSSFCRPKKNVIKHGETWTHETVRFFFNFKN